MEFFLQDLTVSDVRIAIFVPADRARRVHTNRPSHGFAFSVGHTVTYRFDSGPVLQCLPGQCIYLPQGSSYTVSSTPVPGDTSVTPGTYAINFYLLSHPAHCKPFIMKLRGRDKALSCFERAENAWCRKYTGYREDCLIALYQLLGQFRREHTNYARIDHITNQLAPALQYIRAHYACETISQSHLAQLCGISEPYMRKLFHAAFSVSPSNYIRDLRLNYAKELLRSGEYSITSVAARSGFNSAAYFSREFKKATGVSPNQYIRRQQ